MRIHTLSLVLLLSHVDAWMTSTSSSPFPCRRAHPSSLRSSEDTTVIENSAQNSDLQGTKLDRSEEEEVSKLSKDVISKLKFRALHRELKARKLSLEGTTAQLRERLRGATLPDECVVDDSTRAFSEEDCEAALVCVCRLRFQEHFRFKLSRDRFICFVVLHLTCIFFFSLYTQI